MNCRSNSIKKVFFLVLSFLAFLSYSCKKDTPSGSTTTTTTTKTTTTSTTPNLNDTVYNYAKFAYLWDENVPNSFNYNGYQLYIASADSSPLVQAITLYSPLNTTNNLHYDHFSFLLTEDQYNQLFNGTGGSTSFGMDFSQDRNGNFRISYVAHASPAYSQGVRRGFELNAINGIAVTANLSAATASQLNTILDYNSSASFTLTNASGVQETLNISKGSFSDDEVINTTVIDSGTHKVGYIAYNTFITSTDANGNPNHPGLDTAFSKLKAAGVTDLIIDLRYNGGGYTAVAEELDNAILPPSVNGQKMYTETFNDSLNIYHKLFPKDGFPGDSTVYINETSALNPPKLSINNVVFIVSNETVSASELTINNLKPYFPNMKLVGLGKSFPSSKQNTAGKPFGFFNYPFPLPTATSVPQYELFLINFETKNALGQDNYVSGFTPDVQEYDGLEYDWGNPNEDGYKAAFNYLVKGSFSVSNTNNGLSVGRNSVSSAFKPSSLSRMHASTHFVGMINKVNRYNSMGNLNTKIQKAKISMKLSGKGNSPIKL